MRFYFYNSFNLSGEGFSYVVYNTHLHRSERITRENKNDYSHHIMHRFSRSGFETILEKTDDGKYVFMVKNVNRTDYAKAKDEPGRYMYYNIACEADSTESELFCDFAMYVLTEYSGLLDALGEIVYLTENSGSYAIDSLKADAFLDGIKGCAARYSGGTAELGSPKNSGDVLFERLLEDIKGGKIDNRITLVLLSSNPEYFENMQGDGLSGCPYVFDADGNVCKPGSENSQRKVVVHQYSASPDSDTLSPEEMRRLKLIGGIALGAAVIGTIAYVCIKRKERRREY